MYGSTLGNIFRVSTWGESHGKGIGVIIDGVLPVFLLVKKIFRNILIAESRDNPVIQLNARKMML